MEWEEFAIKVCGKVCHVTIMVSNLIRDSGRLVRQTCATDIRHAGIPSISFPRPACDK